MSSATEQKASTFFEVEGWRKVVIWPLSIFLRLWFRTLRFEVAPEDLKTIAELPKGTFLVCWHNCLSIVPEMHRRYRAPYAGLAGMISPSKDGAWLAALFNSFGLKSVRGSSGSRGGVGARELVRALKQGVDAGLTVDGSRGPIYEAKEGAMMLARQSKVPLLLFTARFHRAGRLKSWDRFFIPWPFSRVTMRIETYRDTNELAPTKDRKEATAILTQRLRDLGAGNDPEYGI
tara:strand:+ start:1838 stop:2536 length:699 start_codon:yes stop_codon:yes gene_type:complete